MMHDGYGNDTELRTQLTTLGLRDVAGIGLNISVWLSGRRSLRAAHGNAWGAGGYPRCCDGTSASADLSESTRA